ncbi:MAG: glycosyltransferase family 39 protein [Ruminococcus sp.]|nr:glycosyltransferase family 39 protein [Ruminococcus sp.]
MIKKIPDTRSVIDKISKHPIISSFIICLISHFMFFGYIESNVLPVAAVFDCLIVFIIGMIPVFMLYKNGNIKKLAFQIFMPVYFIAILLVFSVYSSSKRKVIYIIAISAVLIAALYYAVKKTLLSKEKDEQSEFRLKALVIMGSGFILKLSYILCTDYLTRQHDVGGFENNNAGHAGYIIHLMENHKLPDFDLRTVWQFYHPPFHHIIAAIWMKLNETIFGFNNTEAAEGLQTLTLFYTMCIMIAAYKLIKHFNIKGKAALAALAIINFHPSFILFAGSINNDVLSVALMMWAAVYTLDWYKAPTTKNIVKIALCIGLGMMTKLSAAIIAPPTAFIFIMVLIKNIKTNAKNILLQFVCFGLICVPLGTWFQIRSLTKWDIPLGYVQEMPVESPQYVGDRSYSSRLTDFSLLRFNKVYEIWKEEDVETDSIINIFDPSPDPSKINISYSGETESNPSLGMFKTAVFGEFIRGFKIDDTQFSIFNDEAPTIRRILDYSAIVLFWSSVILGLTSLAAMAYSFKLKGIINEKIFLAFFYLFMLFSFYKMCSDYPFTCTMNFRYITPTVITGALFGGIMTNNLNANKNRVSKVISISYNAVSIIFIASAAVTYIGVCRYL